MLAMFVAVERPADLLSGEVNNLGRQAGFPRTLSQHNGTVDISGSSETVLHQLEHWMNTVDLHSNGFVWKCWVNIPNDQQNHWVQWDTLFSDKPKPVFFNQKSTASANPSGWNDLRVWGHFAHRSLSLDCHLKDCVTDCFENNRVNLFLCYWQILLRP